MKPILALDIATKTGWAVGAPDGDPQHGVIKLPYPGENIGRPMKFFMDWLGDFISVNGVGHVVFEAPFSQKKKVIDARKLICLAGVVELVCEIKGITCGEIDIQTNKSFFTGKRYAKKHEMIAMCRLYGWHPEDDNDADALALWCYSVNIRHPQCFADRKLAVDMGRRAG